MEPLRLPLAKAFNTPFISLDETSIEMGSLLFLFVAVVIASRIKWRRQLIRHIVQIVAASFFFFFVYSCLGVFGLIRNGLYGTTLIGTVYTESFYWMALPTVIICVTLFTGPVFCGWICPTGTLQEFAAIARRKLLGERKLGGRLEYVLLAFFLCCFMALTIWISLDRKMFLEDSSLHWAASLLLLCYLVLVGVADDQALRRLRVLSVMAILLTTISHITVTSPVHFAFTARDDPASALATLVLVLASFIIARSWCRYLCPWGWVMGLMHRFSRLQLRTIAPLCDGCGDCVRTCDVDAIESDSADRIAVNASQCQFCLACVDVCPTEAIEVVDVWNPKERSTRRLPIIDSVGDSALPTGTG